jgi:glycosyltransferase involved in cell wall biosynthesis
VLFLASGQASLRVTPPGVVTVHRFESDRASWTAADRQRLELLRSEAARGVVVHAVTHALAHALIDDAGIDRDSIVTEVPGIGPLPAGGVVAPCSGIAVVAGGRPRCDQEIAAAISAAGVVPSVVESVDAGRPPRCVVVATPDTGFPHQMLRAMALGIPVVAARTETTTELLEGAATLVDPLATEELAAAALELARDDVARSVSVTAGRARASDYSWDRRGGGIVRMLRRAVATS